MKTMTTAEMINLAKSHQHEGDMPASAQCCIQDAEEMARLGEDALAMCWVVKSLFCSVGILHPDYQQAHRVFCGFGR
jgi:hypothetical protein